jgi:hypothetical protein
VKSKSIMKKLLPKWRMDNLLKSSMKVCGNRHFVRVGGIIWICHVRFDKFLSTKGVGLGFVLAVMV